MDIFIVTREDDCIWVEDTRMDGKDGLVLHLVPEQALELGQKLIVAAMPREGE